MCAVVVCVCGDGVVCVCAVMGWCVCGDGVVCVCAVIGWCVQMVWWCVSMSWLYTLDVIT